MRVDNIEITMKIPLPIDKPDGNGVTYSREALVNGFKDCKGAPLVIVKDDGSWVNIGTTRDIQYHTSVDGDFVVVNAVLWNGGTCEDVKMDNGVVYQMNIESVGIATD